MIGAALASVAEQPGLRPAVWLLLNKEDMLTYGMMSQAQGTNACNRSRTGSAHSFIGHEDQHVGHGNTIPLQVASSSSSSSSLAIVVTIIR
jgi:hypothetical protein